MRPATAVTKKSQNHSARSIWKKYQGLKPQKNQFYCFKTISQIIQAHQGTLLREAKDQLYYHRIASPKKLLKQTNLTKDTQKQKISSMIERNPTIKKSLSNNYFSSKQIGKQNTQIKKFAKVKTQQKIINQRKFTPYRQQPIAIRKHSNMFNQLEYESKQENLQPKKSHQIPRKKQKTANRNPDLKQRPRKCHIIQHSKTQKHQEDQFGTQQNQFAIEQWSNFKQDNLTFSMLINGNKFH